MLAWRFCLSLLVVFLSAICGARLNASPALVLDDKLMQSPQKIRLGGLRYLDQDIGNVSSRSLSSSVKLNPDAWVKTDFGVSPVGLKTGATYFDFIWSEPYKEHLVFSFTGLMADTSRLVILDLDSDQVVFDKLASVFKLPYKTPGLLPVKPLSTHTISMEFDFKVSPGSRYRAFILHEGFINYFEMFVGSVNSVVADHKARIFSISLALGIIFGLFLFNLIMYFMLKVKDYLFYLLYLGFLLLSQIFINSFDQLVGLREFFEHFANLQGNFGQFFYVNITSSAATMFLALFISRYLNLRKHSPWLNRLLIVPSLLFFVSVTLGLMLSFFWTDLEGMLFLRKVIGQIVVQAGTIVPVIVIIATFVASFYLKVEGARIILVSLLTLMVGSLIYILSIKGIFPANFFTSRAILFGAACEVFLFSFGLASKYRRRQIRYEKSIETFNERLSVQVDNQKQKIRALLDNIDYGIMPIYFDHDQKELCIAENYSQLLPDLLFETELAHKSLKTVFLNQLKLGSDQLAKLHTCLMGCMNEDQLTFELNQEHFPKDFSLVRGDRHLPLRASWNSILSKDGVVQMIVVVLKDMSQELRSAENERLAQRKMKLLTAISSVPRHEMASYFALVEEIIDKIRKWMSDPQPTHQTTVLLAYLHSLKSYARGYSLDDLSNWVHDLESKAQAQNLDRESIQDAFQEVVRLNSYYKNLYESIHGDLQDPKVHEYAIDRNFLRRLESLLASSGSVVSVSKVKQLMTSSNSNLHFYFNSFLQRIIKTTNARKNTFVNLNFIGDVYSWDQAIVTPLKTTLSHLVRNSLTHGLVTGRDEFSINLKVFDESSEFIVVRVSDDGLGLDIEALQKKVENEMQSPWLKSQGELAELVLAGGISTKNEITQEAGRGVGLTAARISLEEINSQIKLVIFEEKNNRIPIAFDILIPQKYLCMQHWKLTS